MIKKVLSETRVPVKIWTDEIEKEAEQQLVNLANLPFVERHVAVMPDVHSGKGSTIGTVFASSGAVIPSAVGVDIGCGMAAVSLGIPLDRFIGHLPKIRSAIEASVPVGFNSHNSASDFVVENVNGLGTFSAPFSARPFPMSRIYQQCGTLGGGNHFIELCFDEKNLAWILLHSGSRNIGKVVAEFHIDRAKEIMKEYFISLPDPDLAYLAQGTKDFKAYVHDLNWCQRYAFLNREVMLERVIHAVFFGAGIEISPAEITGHLHSAINCHHNYCQFEHHFGKNVLVTRKGAVSARAGELGIIPGSMGECSFIVEGLGNPESFQSCSHGAGRKMSRTKAREKFTRFDLEAQTQGVECRKDSDIVDEIPAAYKDIFEVMNNQSDLVSIRHRLKQVLCVKG